MYIVSKVKQIEEDTKENKSTLTKILNLLTVSYCLSGISANCDESDGTFGEQCDDLQDFEIFEQSLKNKLVFQRHVSVSYTTILLNSAFTR